MVKVRGTPFSSTMMSMANAKNEMIGGLRSAAATGRSAAEQSGSGLKSVAGGCLALAQGYLQA